MAMAWEIRLGALQNYETDTLNDLNAQIHQNEP